MQNKILSLLGLSKRAGKLVTGHDPVIKAIKEKKVFLVLLASDFSDHSKKEIVNAARSGNTAVLTLPFEKEELSAAVGRLCGVAAVTDRGFCNKLSELIRTDDTDKR